MCHSKTEPERLLIFEKIAPSPSLYQQMLTPFPLVVPPPWFPKISPPPGFPRYAPLASQAQHFITMIANWAAACGEKGAREEEVATEVSCK